MLMKIADIAKLAGVSPAAVSLALNDKAEGMLGAETAERIRRIAEQTGYRPHRTASALASGRTLSMAFCFSPQTHGLSLLQAHRLYQTLRGLLDEAMRSHYLVSPIPVTPEAHAAERLVSEGFDGAVLYAGRETQELAETLRRGGMPCVVVSRAPVSSLAVDRVETDDVQGSHDATKHLIELGHERIALLGYARTSKSDEKFVGYRAAIDEAGIAWRSQWLIRGEDDNPYRVGYEAADKLMSMAPRPTAVLCVDDIPAYGLIFRLESLGFRVPESMSVVGYGNDELSALTVPALTSIDWNAVEMGRAAARLLLNRMGNGKRKGHQRVLVDQSLVVRETTGPPSNAS